MKVVIGSISPVKEEAVKRGFKTLFPDTDFIFECVKANSGISHQPMSNDETRIIHIGRIDPIGRMIFRLRHSLEIRHSSFKTRALTA